MPGTCELKMTISLIRVTAMPATNCKLMLGIIKCKLTMANTHMSIKAISQKYDSTNTIPLQFIEPSKC